MYPFREPTKEELFKEKIQEKIYRATNSVALYKYLPLIFALFGLCIIFYTCVYKGGSRYFSGFMEGLPWIVFGFGFSLYHVNSLCKQLEKTIREYEQELFETKEYYKKVLEQRR